MDGIKIFNGVINKNLIQNNSFLLGRAAYLPSYQRIFKKLRATEAVRSRTLLETGLVVPPILIISVTNDCNLACKGCYACAQDRRREDEISISDIDRIVGEGVEAGVGIVFIAGGEPLLKDGILEVPRKYRNTLFVMFTNGLLIDESVMREIHETRNLVPAFSLEGDQAETDERRGPGVFSELSSIMKEMNKQKMMFGASITLTRNNYESVMNHGFLSGLDKSGCRALFLIEYVPCEGDPEKCLTEFQKQDLLEKVGVIRKLYSMLPVALPGDESKFGGCLAAGRGFLHISSTGSVEACPFAPFSDVNLKQMSFSEALKSRLLSQLRDNHDLLEEAEGGCTLFENRAWVEQLIGS